MCDKKIQTSIFDRFCKNPKGVQTSIFDRFCKNPKGVQTSIKDRFCKNPKGVQTSIKDRFCKNPKGVQEYFSKHAFLYCPGAELDEKAKQCVDEDEDKNILSSTPYPITFSPSSLTGTLSLGETKFFSTMATIPAESSYRFVYFKTSGKITINHDIQPSGLKPNEFKIQLEISAWGNISTIFINYYAVNSNDERISDILIIRIN